MALFGRDYDRDFGYYGGAWGTRYDRGWSGANRGTWETGYDRGYGANPGDWNRDSGRGYKTRWETDYGDPFGDRSSRTPMRMIRGEYRGGGRDYDRIYRNQGSDYTGYPAGYPTGYPAGYDPYGARPGGWNRGDDRYYRAYGRGYDTGWF